MEKDGEGCIILKGKIIIFLQYYSNMNTDFRSLWYKR